MIGVIASAADQSVVREFFELFKTPWEFARTGSRYEVLLYADGGPIHAEPAALTVVYSGRPLPCDLIGLRECVPLQNAARTLRYGNGDRIPLYCDGVGFPTGDAFLAHEGSGTPVAYRVSSESRTTVRLGYDLFREIRFLLTEGQPAANADIPTLELHIQVLRDVIAGQGIDFA